MALKDDLIGELKHESTMTRKRLERVPFDRKDWKPHEKSMTLGRLATHVAENPGWATIILGPDTFDFLTNYPPPKSAANAEELIGIFQENLDRAISSLEKATDEDFNKTWKVTRGEHLVMETKKKAAIRGWAYSHNVHHRGQLSVYLRLLSVPVPGMYGPSADER